MLASRDHPNDITSNTFAMLSTQYLVALVKQELHDILATPQ
jgi:hypothetical protein